MTVETTTKTHRRVVTGHRDGKAVILSDERRQAYGFKTVAGFEQTYIWATERPVEADPVLVEQRLPRSALPSAGGSLFLAQQERPAGDNRLHHARRFDVVSFGLRNRRQFQ